MATSPVNRYQVGIICALPRELAAARAVLDTEHKPLHTRDPQDSNSYVLGQIDAHNVVIACLPAGSYGTNAAATVATNMLRTFPAIRFGLMIGIGGAIPIPGDETAIRLGDVVVSQPTLQHGGVVQYDLGKRLANGNFQRTGILNRPPTVLLTALSAVQSHPIALRRRLHSRVLAITQQGDLQEENYEFPGVEHDDLPCTWCDPSLWTLWLFLIWSLLLLLNPFWQCKTCVGGKIPRLRKHKEPDIHYGVIASGNSLVKNVTDRNRIGKDEGAICVEMEAAGLMNDFPCLVIRGICDYADSRKNKIWQNYAAATAAAFANELLIMISPVAVDLTTSAIYAVDNDTRELLEKGIDAQIRATEMHRQHYQNLQIYQKLDEEEKCLQALETTTYELYKDNNPDKVPGTCRWVLDHERFKFWRRRSYNGLLWISADPGCGKSVLSKSLVDHGFGDDTEHTICYFFFKDNSIQNNLSAALCAILHQLFTQQPLLLQHAMPAWKANHQQIRKDHTKLWSILLCAAADPVALPIVCILDALDECREEDRRRLILDLCDFYQNLSDENTPVRLRVLATSRPYDNVQRYFSSLEVALPEIHLRGEDENVQINFEINLVIDQYIKSWADEFQLSVPQQNSLQQRLQRMEHRTYLWLHLAAEEIRITYRDSLNRDEELFDSLPNTVEEAYEHILQRISQRQRSRARKILLIIIGARRPLTIKQMGVALNATEAYDTDQMAIRLPDVQHLEKYIREWCGLFVYFNDRRLFLIHQTAKEFLIAKNALTFSPPHRWKSSLDMRTVEKEMACLCITNLCLFPPATKNSLREYAGIHWTDHLDPDDLQDQKLLAMTLRWYENESNFSATTDFWSYDFYTMDRLEPLHHAAFHGHILVMEHFLKVGKLDLEARNVSGNTLLHMASSNGQVPTARWLIAHGISIDLTNRKQESPLLLAVKGSHLKSVELLLDFGADVNIRDDLQRTVIWYACKLGQVRVVKLLIDVGAQLNMRDESGQTLFDFVCKCRGITYSEPIPSCDATTMTCRQHWSVRWFLGPSSSVYECLALLLESGIDKNTVDAWGRTALYKACCVANERLGKLLLGAGVDLNIADKNGRTALYEACSRGHAAIAQLLIENAADPNVVSVSGRTALYEACSRGYAAIAQLLIENAADPNVVNANGDTALLIACRWGNNDNAEMLINAGVDVNVVGGNGQTALHASCRHKNVEAIHLLLNAGADVNAVNKTGKILVMPHALANAHRFELILIGSDRAAELSGDAPEAEQEEILIAHRGARMFITEEQGFTPFMYACRAGSVEAIKILIDHDADVRARTQQGQTALMLLFTHWSIDTYARGWKGRRASMSSYESYGVSRDVGGSSNYDVSSGNGIWSRWIDFSDDDGFFSDVPWSEKDDECSSLSEDEIEVDRILNLLIDTGADINAVDAKGKTALALACLARQAGCAKILLENGADTNVIVCDGLTVPLWVCSRGHVDLVQTLIDIGTDLSLRHSFQGATTSLQEAVISGEQNIAQMLLENGADLSPYDIETWTHLVAALGSTSDFVVKWMLYYRQDGRHYRQEDWYRLLLDVCGRADALPAEMLLDDKIIAGLPAGYYSFASDFAATNNGHDKVALLLSARKVKEEAVGLTSSTRDRWTRELMEEIAKGRGLSIPSLDLNSYFPENTDALSESQRFLDEHEFVQRDIFGDADYDAAVA